MQLDFEALKKKYDSEQIKNNNLQEKLRYLEETNKALQTENDKKKIVSVMVEIMSSCLDTAKIYNQSRFPKK